MTPASAVTAVDPMLDHAPCFFLSFGDDGRIAFANTTLLDRLGYSREDMSGKHVETILSRPGRLFYQTHVFPLVKMRARADEIFLLVETKAGEQFGSLWNLVRRERDGRPFVDCAIVEVQERRKYEDALLEAKRAAETANTLLEQQSMQLADQAAELEAQHQQLLEQTEELEVQAEELRVANDELLLHGEALESERLAAREAQRAADEANRAKSEFLATMSHELRTPLNAIGGYTDLIAAGIYGSITDDQRQALDRIARAQRHLLGLINDILNLSRVEAGRVDYSIADVPIVGVVNELRAMIDPQMAANGLEFRVSIDDRLVLRADHEKIVQILLNLLSNAVKFTPAGGRVTLRSRRLDDRLVAIDVEDTGRGIPAAKLEAVFEPFVQVRSDSARKHEGTGLGLAISRNLARGMDGDITVTSAMDQGSIFTLSVPLVL